MRKILITIVLLLMASMAFAATKECYLCKKQIEDKYIALMAVTIENTEVYFCILCLANQAEKPYGISLSMCGDDMQPLTLPTIKHLGIYKEFINPMNDGSAR